MRIEKKEANVIEYLNTFFKERAQKYSIDTVFLYGSWAGGVQRSTSDIDIAVLFSKDDLPDDKAFEYITDMTLALSKDISFEVNIIRIYRDFRLPMLYYNVIVLGKPLYIKDDTAFIDLINTAIYQMEDFSIFGRKWQIQLIRNNLGAL